MASNNETPTFSVSQLGELLKNGLNTLFPQSIWIEGEISNFRIVSKSGHAYFDLIEPSEIQNQQPLGQFGVALWRSQRLEIERILKNNGSLELANNLKVRILANLDFWPPGGRLQLIMQNVDPQFSFGMLAQDKDLLLKELAKEGILNKNSFVSLPRPALKIGLLTSIGSAAHADFYDELNRSGLAFKILERNTQMQGERSAKDIKKGLEILTSHAPDVIALIRGGGSMTDLMPFNSEIVARSITETEIPVFTGIGHEIDKSIADEVAHSSYKTPTACAAGLIENTNIFMETIFKTKRDVANLAQQKIKVAELEQKNLYSKTRSLSNSLINNFTNNLENIKKRLHTAAPVVFNRHEARLSSLKEQISALDPERLFDRGWSIARTDKGEILFSADAIAQGDKIVTVLKDGEVESTVNERTND